MKNRRNEAMKDLDYKIIVSESIFAQKIDGEMVLLDMNSENYFGLDSIGTEIWQKIERHEGDLRQVFDTLIEQYEVAPEVLKSDLLLFVENLEKSGLIVVKDI
jgi:hypothetical protein